MRWLGLFLIALIMGFLLLPTPAKAENPVVNITVTGWVVGETGLTVTWISDTEVRLDWTRGPSANATMIRVEIGSAPVDRNDGYLVYYGGGFSFTDIVINLDLIGAYVYYGAWSQNEDGNWEETGSIAFIGGAGMTEIADTLGDGIEIFLLLFVVALITALAIWKRDSIFLRIIAAPVLIIYGLSLADGATGTGTALWVAGVIVAIIGTSFIFSIAAEVLLPRLFRKRGKGEG